MQILVSISTIEASPQIGEMLPLCAILMSCPDFFPDPAPRSKPLDRSSRFMAQTTCFRARMVILMSVKTMASKPLQNGRE